MSVQLIETRTHVFEVETLPDGPGRIRREANVRLIAGPPLTAEQWGRIKECVVRDLIAAGCRVFAVIPIPREDQ
jgi:hypothetical protein